MSALEPAKERVARQLREAVERLRDDMDRVEFWTEVLGCLSRPAPEYNPDGKVGRLRLPRRDGQKSADEPLNSGQVSETAAVLRLGKRIHGGHFRR
jgi:hypothetical protein